MAPPRRRSLWIVVGTLLLTMGAGWAAFSRLGVDVDTDALLSPSLPWRQQALALRRAFPSRDRSALILIDGPPELQLELAGRLQARLLAHGAPVAAVDAPELEPLIRRNALLYLPLPEFHAVADRLEAAQPLLGRLAARPDLAGLFTILAEITAADPSTRARLYAALAEALDALRRGERPAPLSWQGLLITDAPQRSLILSVRASGRDREAELMDVLDESLNQTRVAGARASLTGEIPLWQAELRAANVGGLATGVTAFVLVSLALGVALRDGRQVLACLLSLAAGLLLTAGLAALAIGRLNLISVAFAALYIGLAIDFALHWLFAWRGATATPHEVSRHVAPALRLCALTTALAFAAFSMTDYRGVAELGRIGAAGIFIGLLAATTLLPALLDLFAARRPAPVVGAPGHRSPGWRWPRRSVALLLLLCLAATPLAMRAGFTADPLALQPPSSALERFRALREHQASPMQALLMVPSAAAAQQAATRLAALPGVGRVYTIRDLIPTDQPQKLERLAELQWSVGASLPDTLELRAATVPDVARAAATLQARLSDSQDKALADGLRRWRAALDDTLMQRTQAVLMGTLPALYRQISDSLSAEGLSLDALPDRLRAHWVDARGRHLVAIEPAQALRNEPELRRFAETVRKARPDAVGLPLEYLAGAETVTGAFRQAFALAGIAIALVLLGALRRPRDVLLALTPLLAGSVLYLGATCAAGLPLNFANIIALPLLFGIAVDAGIHLVWRHRQHPAQDPVTSPTGRAIAWSAITTMASFIALTLSPHPGMASMGLHLAIGLSALLVCTLVLIPALLRLQSPELRP